MVGNVRAWIDAFNRRDAAAAITFYHPDAVNTQLAIGASEVGRDAITRAWVEFFAAFPDNYTHPENFVASGDWVALEWSGGGTWKGPFAGHTTNGPSFALRGCGFFQIRDGLIQEQRGYWDRATWFAQLDILLQ